jgi:O-succinylbenzoate synthase
MISIDYYFYELVPLTHFGAVSDKKSRGGVLLRVKWDEDRVGYADLFPWPELGDLELAKQLEEIKEGRLSYLAEQSIWMANRDASYRKQGRLAFKDLPKLKNHFLIMDPLRVEDATLHELQEKRFTTVKIKLGRSLKEELDWFIKVLRKFPELLFRLDFNQSINFELYRSFLEKLGRGFWPRIEFVEDPFVYEFERWREANQWIPLAMDADFGKVKWSQVGIMRSTRPFEVLILKPARTDVSKFMKRADQHFLKVAVTSSLDHPVGNFHALWVACELKKFRPNQILDGGCISHKVYRSNVFSNLIVTHGPYLGEMMGSGIGFDQLLESLPWIKLR